MNLFELLFVSVKAILPAFFWIFSGLIVRRLWPASIHFFHRGEKFVFFVGMPVVLFLAATNLHPEDLHGSRFLAAGTLAILAMVAGSFLLTRLRGYPLGHRGIVAQAAYRANLAIIGLALCASAFGREGMVIATIPIALWTLLFNVIAVVLLDLTHGGGASPLSVLRNIGKNPLILGILAGLLWGMLDTPLPTVVHDVGDHFADFVIPFALICLGGAISLNSAGETRRELIDGVLLRLIISPALAVTLAYILGVRGTELGVIFLLLGGPAAIACHVMVSAVKGNARLAASIVVMSTLFAPITLTLGLFTLRLLQLI